MYPATLQAHDLAVHPLERNQVRPEAVEVEGVPKAVPPKVVEVGGVPEAVEVEDTAIEVGRAQGAAIKGEDTLYVRGVFDGPPGQRQVCAAIFDGHGGKAASEAALKTVGDRLMDQGPPFSDAAIASHHG